MPKEQPASLRALIALVSVAFNHLSAQLPNDLTDEKLSSASLIDHEGRDGSFLVNEQAPTAAILLEIVNEWSSGPEFHELCNLVLEDSLAKKFLEGGSYPSDPAGQMDVPATLRTRIVGSFREFAVWCNLRKQVVTSPRAQSEFFQSYLVRKLKSGIVPTVELFPVINIVVPGGPQRIADNLILRSVRDSDGESTFQDIDALNRDGEDNLTDKQLALRNWAHQLRVAGKLAGSIFEIYRDAKVAEPPRHRDELVALCILALDQYPSLPIETATNCDDASYRTVSRAGAPIPYPLPLRITLGAPELARLSYLWPKLLLTSSRNSRFSIALRRIAVLFERHTNEDRFIDAWIALEALFGSGTEVRFRVSQRIASFLEPAGENRVGLFQRLIKLYDKRSSLVHGSLKHIEPRILEDTYQVLPRSMHRIIVDYGADFDPDTLDDNLLRGK